MACRVRCPSTSFLWVLIYLIWMMVIGWECPTCIDSKWNEQWKKEWHKRKRKERDRCRNRNALKIREYSPSHIPFRPGLLHFNNYVKIFFGFCILIFYLLYILKIFLYCCIAKDVLNKTTTFHELMPAKEAGMSNSISYPKSHNSFTIWCAIDRSQV